MRSARVWIALIAVIAATCAGTIVRADDASTGYAVVRPSLVKVWAFDAQGRPTRSGTGLVIVANASRALVLTAAHVVDGAARITIDVDRDRHDIPARVEQRGPRDLAVLGVDRGGLTPAQFAPRSRIVVEGNVIAVAGFVEHDELIGIVGQEPRVLYPGTIASRLDGGAYLELENVHVEDGLSGGPVFDPLTGDVVGIVTSRTSDRRGGFADSAALVVEPFLAANAIAFRERGGRTLPVVAIAPPRASPARAPPAHVPLPGPVAVVPVRSPLAVLASRPVTPLDPPALPSIVLLPQAWSATDDGGHRLAFYDGGCPVALSVAVARLSFGVRPVDAALRLRIARRVAPIDACADVGDRAARSADYRVAAASYDGRHLTIRFRVVGAAADDDVIPPDVSLDADLDDDAAVDVRVQAIDAAWSGAFEVSASRAN